MSGLLFSDIPEDEARYWAKKLEQLNAMRDQDVSLIPQHVLTFGEHANMTDSPKSLCLTIVRLVIVAYLLLFSFSTRARRSRNGLCVYQEPSAVSVEPTICLSVIRPLAQYVR